MHWMPTQQRVFSGPEKLWAREDKDKEPEELICGSCAVVREACVPCASGFLSAFSSAKSISDAQAALCMLARKSASCSPSRSAQARQRGARPVAPDAVHLLPAAV